MLYLIFVGITLLGTYINKNNKKTVPLKHVVFGPLIGIQCVHSYSNFLLNLNLNVKYNFYDFILSHYISF